MNVKIAPSVTELHPSIVEFLERNRDWHERHGYEGDYSLQDILQTSVYLETESFLLLFIDDSDEHHGNVSVLVFRSDGTLVDPRIFFHEDDNHPKAPNRSFSGVPIIGDSKAFHYIPLRKRDRNDPLQ